MYIHTCTIELWRSTRPSRVSAYVSGGKSQRRLRHTHTPQCVTFVRVCLPFRAGRTMARIRGVARIVPARSPAHDNTHVISLMDGVCGAYAPPRGDNRRRTREDANPHPARTAGRVNRRYHVCRQDGTSSRGCALGSVRGSDACAHCG